MRRLLLPALLVVILPLTGCASDDGTTTLRVYAAASLTASFEQLADDFEAAHDGVEVELVLGGSSDLVTQIQEGAPADVFASADPATMDELSADDLTAAAPRDFASNTLEIAVPPGNPADVRDLEDLADPGLSLVVCAPEVPCGAAARQLAENAGIVLAPVSEEQSVTDVLAKVTSGEADAGLVYVTDVRAAGDAVEGVTLPGADDVVNVYPIAPVAGSDQAELAREFVDLVVSDAGQDVLAGFGFGPG